MCGSNVHLTFIHRGTREKYPFRDRRRRFCKKPEK